MERIGRNALWTAAGHASRLGANLLFIVLARRALRDTAEFGSLTLAVSYGIVLLFVFLAGLDRLVIRDAARDPGRSASVLTSAVLLQCALFAASVPATLLLLPLLRLSGSEVTLCLIASAASAAQSLSLVHGSLLVGRQKFHGTGLPAFAQSAALAAGSVACASYGASPLVMMLLWTASRVVGLASALLILSRARLLRYSAPRGLGAFALRAAPFALLFFTSVTYNNVETFTLRFRLSSADVGAYQEGFRLFAALIAISNVVELPFYPLLAKHRPRSVEYRRAYGGMLRFMTVAAVGAAGVCYLLGEPLLHLLYGTAVPVRPAVLGALSGALLARFLAIAAVQTALLHGGLVRTAVCFCAGGATSATLTYLLAPVYGAVAAAVGAVAGAGVAFALTAVIVSRLHGVSPARPVALAGGALLLLPLLARLGPLPGALLFSLVVGALALLLFRRGEWRVLRDMLTPWRRLATDTLEGEPPAA